MASNCRYSRDAQNTVNNVCKFYLKGCCTFADRCRFQHVKPKSPQKPHQNTIGTTPRTEIKHRPPPLIDNSGISASSTMVSLKRATKNPEVVTPKTPKSPEEWVQAAEFVPGQPYKCSSIPNSYAHAASNGIENSDVLSLHPPADANHLLCPFSTNKECPHGKDCMYIHGNVCDLCGLAVLKPGDEKQNEEHIKECLEQHEKDMNLSFAVARSKDKQCGICMDKIMEKEPATERRFGILSDCTHCFCLACIRKWRASKQFDNKTIRSCPECRTQSDFVTPSMYWVDTKEEKIKVIQGYKEALSAKPCKYFSEGRGECPFNDKCFYLHLNPDGTKAEARPYRRRHRRNADGELDPEERVTFWDFFQDRQDRLENLLLLLEDDLASVLLNLNFNDSDSELDSDDDEDFLIF